MAPPTTKKAITDRMAPRPEPVDVATTAKIAGPKMPANFSNTEKNPKNCDADWRGIRLAKSDRLSAWLPPCTIADRDGQHEELGGRRHLVGQHADERVHGERDVERSHRAEAIGHEAEQERERNAGELHEQDARRSATSRAMPISAP